MKLIFISLLISICFIFNTNASNCDNWQIKKEDYPDYKKTFDLAKSTKKYICQNIENLNYDDLQVHLGKVFTQASIDAKYSLGGTWIYLLDWLSPTGSIDKDKVSDKWKIRKLTLGIQNNNIELQLGKKKIIIKETESIECDNNFSAPSPRRCFRSMEQLADIINLTFQDISKKHLSYVYQNTIELDRQWARYAEESRSQTSLDIWATTISYNIVNHDDSLSPPPDLQWFVLHPNLIIENVSGAIGGEQTKFTPALEVLGFNYWNGAKYCFGKPCGLSAIITYADRYGVKDEGWGLMAHIDNQYSFGFTKYSGDTGFFITVDLLNLFQDKKSKLNNWKLKISDSLVKDSNN